MKVVPDQQRLDALMDQRDEIMVQLIILSS